MSDRQPFRFWFPYWNTPRPAPQRNPAAPTTTTTPQRPLSRIPTSDGRQKPQSTPASQPTAAAASPRRGAQPPSPSSSSSPSPQRTAAGSASRRAAQPSPSPSSSPSPSPSPSPSASRRSPWLQPSDQRVKQQPATKPSSSPSKVGASELPSPTLSSPSLPKSSIKPLESETPVEKIRQTEESKEETSEEKNFKPELETSKKLDEKPEEKTPVETVTDTKSKQDVRTPQQHELDEKLRGILKETIRFDSEPKHEPVPEEKPEPKPVDKQEENPTVALTPDIKTDSKLKDEGTTQQQQEKVDEKPREIPEESNKSDLQQKHDEKPETEEKQEIQPTVDSTPDIKTEQHVGTPQQEERLDKKLRDTAEEKNETDLEPKQPEKPVDLKEENPQTELVIHDSKPHASSSEEREKSIMVSDAKPSSHSTTGRESVSDGIVKEPEKFEQATVKEKGISQHESFGKTSKVSISSAPWVSSYNGEQANFPKEVRKGLSKLVQKLSIVHSNRVGSDPGGVSIITLAGKNKGATMFIGNKGIKTQERAKVGATGDKERSETKLDKDAPIAASVNSNVQSVNNSVLNESKCKENNPGVHLILSNKQIEESVIPKGKIETPKTQKTASSVTTPQKLMYEPNIRRRCLRGLLMEPSEDDQEDPQKPRRHGCRFSCDGEKKKGRTDDGEGTSKPNNQKL